MNFLKVLYLRPVRLFCQTLASLVSDKDLNLDSSVILPPALSVTLPKTVVFPGHNLKIQLKREEKRRERRRKKTMDS